MAREPKNAKADTAAEAPDGEVWRPVFNHEGLYEVSSHGRIRSLPRHTRTGLLGGKILQLAKSRNGYLRVVFSKDGVAVRRSVHRVVLSAFDRLPLADEEARHLNGNKTENYLSNLAWGSRSANAYDRILHGTQYDNKGERHGNARLSNQQAAEIKRLRAKGDSLRSIARTFHVSEQTISRIANAKGWRHIMESANV
ncbi:MAG: helix-turn-helix domain-containing protein [Proteobacteria bacterium]|nr:helix-turn-helix domain-containing protein [Pseudomonadota bacterium]